MRAAAAPLLLLALVVVAAATDTAPPHPDFGPLADMVAGVMVVREGGVSAALDALPNLHDTTHAYIRTLSLLKSQPSLLAKNASSWTGWSDAQAAKAAKQTAWSRAIMNATATKAVKLLPNKTASNATDPLFAKGQQVEDAFYSKVNPLATKDRQSDKAWMAWKNKMNKIVPDAANDDPAIAVLNEKLAPYNVEVSAKMVMPPSKFENAAAVVAKHFAGIMLEESAVEFSPCLISIHTGAAMADGTLLNIEPDAVRVMNTGAMLWPQGVNLQPALLFVSPMGANVQPQGAQVAPYLMAVSPMGANVQPVGASVTPTDKMVMPVGKQINPVGTSFAPMQHMDMPVANDITPGGAPHLHHGRHLLAGDASKKLTLVDDPLDLSSEFPLDYRNWASLLSNVMLTVTGGVDRSPDGSAAVDALSRLTLDVKARLTAAADGEPLVPRFHLSEPMLAAMNHGGMMMDNMTMPMEEDMHMHDGKGMITKLMTSKTFFRYAPCVVHEMKTGAMGSLTGLRFAPSLVTVMNNLLEARFDGVNVNPMLLYVQNMGANAQPQALNVQPALLYIGPMGVNVQPQGTNVQPTGLSVMPTGVNVAPIGKLVAPVREMHMPVGTLFAPIKNDLTPHEDHAGHDGMDHAGHGDMDHAGHSEDDHAGHSDSAQAPAHAGHDTMAAAATTHSHAPAPAPAHQHDGH